jgi:hypothetical protein
MLVIFGAKTQPKTPKILNIFLDLCDIRGAPFSFFDTNYKIRTLP